MSHLSTVLARNQFSDLINRAAYSKERVVLTRRGKKIAAVVPIEDVNLLTALEEQMDLEDARTALAESRKKGTIPWGKIKEKLGL